MWRCILSKAAITEQKVFVVDDEEQIANLVTLCLRSVSFDVETFYDAASALRRASNCLPDLLISDITMPGMDGITLAKQLRKRNPNCKVILISGNPNWKAPGDLLNDRFGDFALLLKPFSIKQLLCRITSEQDISLASTLEPRLRTAG